MGLPLRLSIAEDSSDAPAGPRPAPAVEALLDEAKELLEAKKPEASLRAAERALAKARETDDAPGLALAHQRGARALEALGRIDEAIVAWQDAASVWESLDAGPEEIEARGAQVLLLVRTGDEGALVAAVKRAVSLTRNENRRLVAAARAGTTGSDQMRRIGRLDAAKRLADAALEVLERHASGSLDVAGSLNNLGNVANDRGDLDAARDYYRRALEINQRHAPGSLHVAASLGNLGGVAADQGDLNAARDYFRRALEIQQRHAPGSLHVAASLGNLGNVANDQGDLDAARDYYRRALEINQRHAPGSLHVAASLNNLGNVANDQGDFEAARELFVRAWDLVRRQGRSVVGDDAWLAFAASHAAYAAAVIRVELALGHPARALQVLEESRAQGLLELFAQRGLAESAATELWAAYKRAERARDRAGERLADAGARIALLEQQLSDLEAQGMTEDELAAKREELAGANAARDGLLSDSLGVAWRRNGV